MTMDIENITKLIKTIEVPGAMPTHLWHPDHGWLIFDSEYTEVGLAYFKNYLEENVPWESSLDTKRK